MLLSIKNLSKTYSNGIKALDNVSLELGSGMFGLVGPNGAGKSTLMRTLATLQEADEGQADLDGIDVLKEKREVRKLLGYLPQEFGVYPGVSAEEMLNHLAALKGITKAKERKETVKALLEQVNLHAARNKKLGSFSGGMKQRFGVAQALLGNPQLIIVDEPTAGLDPAERIRFNNLLTEIGENIIVILSTHIVDDVRALCNEMAIINEGKVLLKGKPDQAINELRGSIWEKTIEKNDMQEYENNFKVIYSRLTAGKLLIHVYQKENPGNDFQEARPDLEDVYFSQINS